MVRISTPGFVTSVLLRAKRWLRSILCDRTVTVRDVACTHRIFSKLARCELVGCVRDSLAGSVCEPLSASGAFELVRLWSRKAVSAVLLSGLVCGHFTLFPHWYPVVCGHVGLFPQSWSGSVCGHLTLFPGLNRSDCELVGSAQPTNPFGDSRDSRVFEGSYRRPGPRVVQRKFLLATEIETVLLSWTSEFARCPESSIHMGNAFEISRRGFVWLSVLSDRAFFLNVCFALAMPIWIPFERVGLILYPDWYDRFGVRLFLIMGILTQCEEVATLSNCKITYPHYFTWIYRNRSRRWRCRRKSRWGRCWSLKTVSFVLFR